MELLINNHGIFYILLEHNHMLLQGGGKTQPKVAQVLGVYRISR